MNDPSLTNELALRKLLADRPDKVVETAIATRQRVFELAATQSTNCSELVYVTYCVSSAFSFTDKLGQAFIHVAVYANHVNLGFNHGAALEDPDQLLEGSGKSIRHIRIESLAMLKSPAIRQLISAAVSQGIEMADNKGGQTPPSFHVKDSRKK